MPKMIVGLDIGSQNICATIATENNGQFEILESVCEISKGVKKGKIVDSSVASKNIRDCLQKLSRLSEFDITRIYVGVSCDECKVLSSRGVSFLQEGEKINHDHIEEAYTKGRKIKLAEDECVVDGIINWFYTEEKGFTQNPLGIKCEKLELELDLVIAKKDSISSLKEAILKAGYEINGFVLSIDTLKKIFLNDKTLTQSVAIIDVGSDKTDIAVFKSNQIKAISSIDLGGHSVTKDLSICTKMSEEEAENLKKMHSFEYLTLSKEKETIIYNGKIIETYLLQGVIEARLEEIVSFIKDELIQYEEFDKLEKFIFTGDGIGYYENCEEVLLDKFSKKIRIFTKKDLNFNNSSIINSIAIVKDVYDRLKLVCKEEVFYNNVLFESKEEINYEKLDTKSEKKYFSKIRGFFEEFF